MGLFGGQSEEELRTSGTPTTARVTYVDDTGKRRANGTEAKVKVQLKIDSGSARGRELDQAKWVPVTKMPHVGETVHIRFDPDHVGDWAWGDAAMYEPTRASVDVQPAAHAAPGSPPAAAGAPAAADPMSELIKDAMGPWGNMPGLQKMIDAAMASGGVTFDQAQMIDLRGAPPAPPPSPPASAGPAEPAQETAERLKRLDKLLEQGLVTAEEHRELRRKIIDSI
jgi:hypothetical protein